MSDPSREPLRESSREPAREPARPKVQVTFHPDDGSAPQQDDRTAPHAHEITTTLAPGARWFFQALALMVLALVIGLPAINGTFLPQDDVHVTDNVALRAWHGLRPIWLTPQRLEGPYPMTFTSYLLQYRVFGDSPTGYRAVNLILHGLVVVLLWTLLKKLGVPGAWFAAAIFAVHPVQVASVAWIAQHKAMLCGVFFVASLIVYFRFNGLNPQLDDDELDAPMLRLSRSRAVLYALSMLLLLFALASQAIAVVFVPVVLITVWWKRGRLTRGDLRPLIFSAGLTLIAAIAFAVIEYRHGARGPEFPRLLERVELVGYAFWSNLRHLIAPFSLSFAYPRFALRPGVVWQYLPTLALIGVLLALWRMRRSVGRGGFAAAMMFAVFALPYAGVVNFKWMTQSFVGDHLLYLACAVAAITVVIALMRFGRVAPVALGVLVVVLTSLSLVRAREYRDSKLLWTATLARDPRNVTALNQLGRIAMEDNNSAEAFRHFARALGIDDDNIAAHLNLARLYDSTDQLDLAFGEFHQVLRRDSNNADAHFGLATIHARQGHSREAIRQYERVIELRPDQALAYLNLGRLHEERDEPDSAIARYRDAIRVDPRSAQVRLNLASLLLRYGQTEAAMDEVRTIIDRIDRNSVPAWMQAGAICRAEANKQSDLQDKRALFAQAAEYFRVATVLDSSFVFAWRQRATVLMAQARLEPRRETALRLMSEAIAAFNRAAQLRPDDPEPAQLSQAAQAERAARDAARDTSPTPPVTRPTH